MKVTVCYVGSSLLAPLREAEREINRAHNLGLEVAAHHCGEPLDEEQWRAAGRDLAEADLVFILHVTDAENAARIINALATSRARAVVAINCMADLMRRTRMGRLDFGRETPPGPVRQAASWMAASMRRRKPGHGSHGHYLKLIGRLPAFLKYLPGAGRLGDVKHYLQLFCYFLQPTPANIRMMLLYAIKQYLPGHGRAIECRAPESAPAVAVYHPDAGELFETFEGYRRWHERARGALDPARTVGLLLLRPQVVSGGRAHYDGLIRAIEAEGLGVIPALATFMDHRESCRRFFTVGGEGLRPRVSQVLSLTGFSFVGGPAMNDSAAAVAFLRGLNVPFHTSVSLDLQSLESWEASALGLNPMQTGMQVAIPELDGATEPFVFGGMPARGERPAPLPERCRRIARRLARWNRLRTLEPAEARLALLIFCFPPNKGDLGTAAELDVFPSVWEVLRRLGADGYRVEVPADADALREQLLGGNSADFGTVAHVAYRMDVDEYRRLCPYVEEIEAEWGRAPGAINSRAREVLVTGIQLGNVFLGVQPTFGYEGDPMRLLAARSGGPHHGFMALYTYLEKVFRADAVVHVGTHGALEFMPGKQAGLSARCWPDRLIGELPHLYLYSVNNPSEGTIAKRRAYAELISYLTPPLEAAGLYRDLAALKELLAAFRESGREPERAQLYAAIAEQAARLNLTV